MYNTKLYFMVKLHFWIVGGVEMSLLPNPLWTEVQVSLKVQ